MISETFQVWAQKLLAGSLVSGTLFARFTRHRNYSSFCFLLKTIYCSVMSIQQSPPIFSVQLDKPGTSSKIPDPLRLVVLGGRISAAAVHRELRPSLQHISIIPSSNGNAACRLWEGVHWGFSRERQNARRL